MVDALAPDRSNQSFGEAVLPRRTWGDGLVTDAHGAQSVRDDIAIDAIPITDHVARCLSPRECLRDLACDPVRGRMGCDVDSDKVSARQPDDDEGIEQVEANTDQFLVHTAGFPTPVPAKAAPMPTYDSLGPDDRDGPENRWGPSIAGPRTSDPHL